MNLVIVESPTKAKTISKFLGSNFKVLSSYGHVRDLPKSIFGIDIENNFQPKYVIIPKAKKTIQLLKKELEKSETCFLATDPDREGEAIAWHLVQVLNLNGNKNQKTKNKTYKRIVFHEITKPAIEEALENPRKIDMNLVNAQQARRILDRIVGYKLSPFLWKKVARGLSAGRVQSVAVRLVCEREKEIENFIPQEYWSIEALLKKNPNSKLEKAQVEKAQVKPVQPVEKAQVKPVQPVDILHRFDLCQFKALLVKKNGENIPKMGIKTKEEVNKIVEDLKGAVYKVANIEKKEIKRSPLPPFITSTLQQTAWQKFHWPAKKTMQLAQQLYEKGFITYHRSDSLNISNLALSAAKNFIIKNYGQNYYQFRKYKTKSKLAQEAHEAIRPTFVENKPEKIRQKLEENQLKLYQIIWQRFIACQMADAIFDSTVVDIAANNYIFRATGQTLKFDGFLKIYPIKYEETELPPLEINEFLELIKLIPSQHFTQPPPRYNEATLIKELEKNGIGRPSTYAPILSTIQERNYIEKDEQKRFKPTEIGIIVNDLLVNHFSEIVDINFTAKMEEDLDKIAEGKKAWIPTIKEFYQPFEENLKKKYEEISKKDIAEKETEKKCPLCQAPLLLKLGKFGRFYACSRFPQCKYTEPLEENKLKVNCPKCQAPLVEKRTKKRKIFYACSNWPKCDFALWEKPTSENCPKCGSLLVETKRKQIKCSNKDCNFQLKKE